MKHLSVATVVVAAVLSLAWLASGGVRPIWGVPALVVMVAAAFVVQVFGFFHALVSRTERYFDLLGSLTYISLAVVGLATNGDRRALSWLLAAMVVVWAARLGSFLFRRVTRNGGDDRFEEILTRPARLLVTWMLQGAWISITGLAAWIGITSVDDPRLDGRVVVGVAVWVVGLAIEVVADHQKKTFRDRDPQRREFIREGLWAWSRHPNYFGEIVLWIGVFLVVAPYLQGFQWLAILSPLFVVGLLTRVSGIPLLEKKADAAWGGRADYEEYKRTTSVLIPLPTRRGRAEAADGR